MHAPWITAIAAPHLVRAVAAVGGDADGLAARFGLPARPRYEDRLALATLIDAWEAAIAATGRRDLPLLAATRVEQDEHSLVAFIVANQPRLGDGIALLDRFYPTVSNAYRWRIADGGARRRAAPKTAALRTMSDGDARRRAAPKTAALRTMSDGDDFVLRASPPGPVDRLGWQAYLESEAADMIGAGRRLTGGRGAPIALRFLHPAPAPDVVAAVTAACGVAPVYASEVTEIVWPAAVLDMEVPTARPHLATLIRDRLEAMLEAIERGDGVVSRARLAIAGLLRDGDCDVAKVARVLGMSRRSLERALADDGTSASALIDDERRQLALAWLPALSVDEVASRLGYSDARAFARAFKRWTGQAPSAVRKR